MKKFTGVLLAVLLVFSFSACNVSPSGGSSQENTDKLRIVTTIFPQYDFARQITGGKAELTMLLQPGVESHGYEPSPKDIIKIQQSDLFIYVGGESDKWVYEVLSSLDTENMCIIKLMDCVNTLEEEHVEGMEEGHEEEADGYEYDEHVWTSPGNAIKIAEKISEAVCEADKDNASYYKENTESYLKKLKELDNSFTQAIKEAKRHVMVFGDRFPFRYFTDAYGLTYYAAFPGCSSETEPSAATLKFLIDKVKDEKIPCVFYIEMSDQKVADTICEATGAKKLLFHSCHNVTKEEFESGVTYLSLMQNNYKNLLAALN